MKWPIRLVVLLLALGIAAAQTTKAAKTDAEIRQEIMSSNPSQATKEAVRVRTVSIEPAGCADGAVRTVGPEGIHRSATRRM